MQELTGYNGKRTPHMQTLLTGPSPGHELCAQVCCLETPGGALHILQSVAASLLSEYAHANAHAGTQTHTRLRTNQTRARTHAHTHTHTHTHVLAGGTSVFPPS